MMRPHLFRAACLAAVLFCGFLSLWSRTSTPPFAWQVTNTANTSSGLPSDQVHSLRFDSRGNLYVSTNLAFARYNGTEWYTFTDRDGFTWQTDKMGKIYIDAQDNVWLCSEENGLAKLSPDNRFTLYTEHTADEPGLAGNTVWDIVADADGGYYIADQVQHGNALSHVNARGEWTHYNFDVFTFNPFDALLCLAYDPQTKTLWAGTMMSGVMYFDGESFQPVSEEYQIAVSELAVHGDYLYAATDLGLMTIDLKEKKLLSLLGKEQGLADDFSTSVAVDAQGTVWVGSDGAGLTRLSATDTTVFNTQNGLSSNDIYSIAFNAQSLPWLGTRIGGICHYTESQTWAHIGATGLPANTVNGMLFEGIDSLWYATSAGVSLYDGHLWKNFTLKTDHPQSLNKDYAGRILQDNQNPDLVWASGYGGVASYSKSTDEWHFYPFTHTVKNDQGVEEVRYPQLALMQASDGTFWATTFGEKLGFASFNPASGEYTFYNDTNIEALPAGNNSFFSVVESPARELWFCSVDGVLIRDTQGAYTLKKFPMDMQVTDPETGQTLTGEDNNVRHVTFAPDGRVWISKLGGIIIYDPQTDTSVQETGRTDDPLSIVSKIVFDGEGNAFVGTLLDGLFLRTAQGEYHHIAQDYGLEADVQILDMYMHGQTLYLCTDKGVYATDRYGKIVEIALGKESVTPAEPIFRLYPNPATDYLRLPGEAAAFALYDLSGHLLLQGGQTEYVDLSPLPAGKYIVRCLINSQWMSRQLIVQ